MHKLVIENLMAIQKCELTLNRFVLLIGEQSVGKSTIIKSVFYMRHFPEILLGQLERLAFEGIEGVDVKTTQLNSYDITAFRKPLRREITQLFEKIFGLSFEKKGLRVRYYFSDEYWVENTTSQEGFLNLLFSPALEKKFKELVQSVWEIYALEISAQSEKEKTTRRVSVYRRLAKLVDSVFGTIDETNYIPAGRSMLTTLSNQLGRLDIDGMDYANTRFNKQIMRLRENFQDGFNSTSNNQLLSMQRRIEKVLKGQYRYENGSEYLYIDRYNRLPINFMSSGQQEMLWLLYSLYFWAMDEYKKDISTEKRMVLIEEPEAHLFPIAQKQVVELIASFANATGSSVIISTHSPYILTAFNNLLYAGHVGQKNGNAKAVNQVVSKDTWLNICECSAYMVTSDALSFITDVEMGEIIASKIDGVSQIINSEYSSLYAIDEESAHE